MEISYIYKNRIITAPSAAPAHGNVRNYVEKVFVNLPTQY